MTARQFVHFACRCAILALMAVSLYAGQGQTGSASLAGFYLPGFGPDGYKTWDIQGRESHVSPTDDSRLEISGLLLSLYSGGEKARLEMTIKSASALVVSANKETRVSGSDILYLTGANDSYSVSGYDWSWSSSAHLIQLKRSVTVKFNSTASATATGCPRQPTPITLITSSEGSGSSSSTGRMSRSSSQRLREAAAASPSPAPTATARVTAAHATPRALAPPRSTSVSTSRPRASVPSG